jgi:hypothetical protein
MVRVHGDQQKVHASKPEAQAEGNHVIRSPKRISSFDGARSRRSAKSTCFEARSAS